uniref:Pre-mRNA-processing ATP-dependent RNA helicase prp-5 n=1 Tax=Arundo donax TaxID=35708 RepID=A0A0A9EF32_ARUDO
MAQETHNLQSFLSALAHQNPKPELPDFSYNQPPLGHSSPKSMASPHRNPC